MAIKTDKLPLSLYVHLPWCERKCPYCDFNSHATATLNTTDEQAYLNALALDLANEAESVRGRDIQTVFIGGGTPSLFSADGISQLLDSIKRSLAVSPDAEITLEANPGSSEYVKFAQFRETGINRLSLGIQSFNNSSLQALGRIHTATEAHQAFDSARQAGFDNINADIMFGLPAQTTRQGIADIQTAINLRPEHISYYQLTIEPNTLFYSRRPELPDDGTLAELETAALTLLEDNGYQRYEVSAYAQPNRASRHNLNYWRYGDYLGAGAGAHSKLSSSDGRVLRFAKPRHPDSYMQAVNQGNTRVGERTINKGELVFEFMLNALRLTGGFDKALFAERTGLDFESARTRVDSLKQKHLLEEHPHLVKTSKQGLKFLNDVQMAFLP